MVATWGRESQSEHVAGTAPVEREGHQQAG